MIKCWSIFCRVWPFFVLVLLNSSGVLAQAAQCPAIDCDCRAFSSESWQQKCLSEEALIVASCIANNGKPSQYCNLHGPKGFPLALQSSFENVEVLVEGKAQLKTRTKAISAALWSVRNDIDVVNERIDNRHFGEALQMLSIIVKSVQDNFKNQRRLGKSYESLLKQDKALINRRLFYEKKREQALASWRVFADEAIESAQQFEVLADTLWKKMEQSSRGSDKKAYRILSIRLLRMTGELRENAGYALAKYGDAKNSAGQWLSAAKIATLLLEYEQATTKNLKKVNYYRYQAAARLNRASYHWLENNNEKQALANHAQATELLSPTARPQETLKDDSPQPVNEEKG